MLAVHVGAAQMPISFQSIVAIVESNPIYFFFLAHPLMFAVIFGALGTMRANRDARIRALMASLEKQNAELQQTNARLGELDRLKSEFLANVTHELKSPLVTAIGYNDRILGAHLGEINDKQRDALEISKRNLIRLRDLISEIMDFSRLDAGVGKFEMQPVQLDAVVAAAVENLTLKANERKISITTAMPAIGARVLGDRQKLLPGRGQSPRQRHQVLT